MDIYGYMDIYFMKKFMHRQFFGVQQTQAGPDLPMGQLPRSPTTKGPHHQQKFFLINDYRSDFPLTAPNSKILLIVVRNFNIHLHPPPPLVVSAA